MINKKSRSMMNNVYDSDSVDNEIKTNNISAIENEANKVTGQLRK